jgi:hypothetical protein
VSLRDGPADQEVVFCTVSTFCESKGNHVGQTFSPHLNKTAQHGIFDEAE